LLCKEFLDSSYKPHNDEANPITQTLYCIYFPLLGHAFCTGSQLVHFEHHVADKLNKATPPEISFLLY